MDFINRTPHAIVIRTDNGDITLEPTGVVARVVTKEYTVGTVEGGIPIVKRIFGEVQGIDDLPDDAICIVSSLVLEAAKAKGVSYNLYAPDTGPTAVRDEKGQIVAVTRLIAG